MNKWIIVAVIFLSSVAFAQDKPEQPAQEAPTPSGRALQELMETEKQVSGLAAKVNGKQASIDTLIKQKQAERDPEKVAEIIKLLQQEHRDWSSLVQEYNSKLNVLKYRFPERGATFERKYKRFNPRSLDQMEQSVGVEKHLHQSRDKVNRVYGVEPQKRKPPQTEKVAPEQSDNLLKPKTISK